MPTLWTLAINTPKPAQPATTGHQLMKPILGNPLVVAALGGHSSLLKADMLAREWKGKSQLLEKTSRPRLWVGQEWGDPEPR